MILLLVEDFALFLYVFLLRKLLLRCFFDFLLLPTRCCLTFIFFVEVEDDDGDIWPLIGVVDVVD